MKTIKLISKKEKTLILDQLGNTVKKDVLFKTVDLLDSLLSQRFDNEGFSVKEINARIKLLDKLSKNESHFDNEKELEIEWDLEDAEYDLIKQIVQKMDDKKLFVVVNQFVVDFATPFLI